MADVKLAVTADLRLPVCTDERVSALGREIQAFAPDAVIVAGDVGESLSDFKRCLQLLREQIRAPIWVLAGNDDVYARPPHDSRKLWLEAIPATVRLTGCQWLEGAAFVIRGVAVAGTIAWYDYSAADANVQASALEYAQRKIDHTSGDALRIDWEWSDPEFADRVSTPFLSQLDHLESDPSVKRVVVVTHVPLLEGQMHRDAADPRRGFANAYLGNLTLGRKVLARRKVSHIVSGHTRIGKHCTQMREGAPAVEANVLASEYGNPNWLGLNVSSED